ncbi:hypothetical protein B0T17DRAFT_619041 [Bombardia bombarda]|uniref:non-specific serine/threonine protein kinase n=1 Tax=Bombardia bombarda TaxID=252184 RepID=A0AA39WN30_9PEZI|nr:hypothetical protein B0T17DRAFT_619041 [Bombardia bombarda]
MTKQNILKHKETFGFPTRPAVSSRCQHLIASLIQDKENRLCSKRYRFKDLVSGSSTSNSPPGGRSAHQGGGVNGSTGRSMGGLKSPGGPRDFAGRYVFPQDAEDIKSHRWFKGVPWERLHEVDPPHVPQLCSVDDTHYFDEDDEISDWSDSETSESEQQKDVQGHFNPNPTPYPSPPLAPQPAGDTRSPHAIAKEDEARMALRGIRRSVQKWAMATIVVPYDSTRLRNIDAQIDSMPGISPAERAVLRQFVRNFGRKERKRPRDRLLRDRNTRGISMEVRKKTAFLGYTWRRMRPPTPTCIGLEQIWDAENLVDCGNEVCRNPVNCEETMANQLGTQYGGGAWRGAGRVELDGHGGFQEFREDDTLAMRSLHRGRLSLL